MTDYFLEITLLSPLTSSAGEGRVGLADQDVAYDDLGLPILPGRRLKGLWREAYRDVVDAWGLCGKKLMSAEDVFGEAGKKPDDGKSGVHVGNAELHDPKAPSFKEWLEYMQHPSTKSDLHFDDVIQHFADIRAQTAMDRDTGAALENTFRLTRTLKTGWVFRAPVHFVTPPDEALLTALVLGAAALQHMGTARTRGLGKVRCHFICGSTEKVLGNNTLPTIDTLSSVQLSQTSEVEDVDCTTEQTQSSENQITDAHCCRCLEPSYLLRYRLILREPAVIPVVDGDPNTVVTRQAIPGSQVFGVAAWNYLRQSNHSPEDDIFCHLFLDGVLRFLTAYPETLDKQQRMIPTPHSIREFKKSKAQVVDFLKQPPDRLRNQPTKRLGSHHASISQKGLEIQTTKTGRNYHHARAANDRRIGRALGSEIRGGGALFQYEALKAGQSFQGVILGSMEDLAKLQMWLPHGSLVSIGRSRSAQYGETEFEWVDETPKELSGVLAEWNAFIDREDYEPEDLPPVLDDNRLIITTLSPLLAVDDNGHPAAHFPTHELANVLGVKACELKLSCSYTRTEMISGYHSHLRLPRQQCEGIAAGSVFVFCINAILDEKRLLKLERNGLGLRKNEGFGRIAANRQDNLNLYKEIQLDNPEKQKRRKAPDGQIPPEIENILKGVVLRRCLAEMQSLAMLAARTIVDRTPKNRLPSNSLLGRFRLILQRENLKESSKELLKLGKEKLSNHQIEMLNHDIPELKSKLKLYDLFEHIVTQRSTITYALATKHVKSYVESRYNDTHESIIKALVEVKSDEMCRVFLNNLLTTLNRVSRPKSTPAE